eukprot:14400344-Ditylum_brightwellii.AAC.1
MYYMLRQIQKIIQHSLLDYWDCEGGARYAQANICIITVAAVFVIGCISAQRDGNCLNFYNTMTNEDNGSDG